MQAVILTAMVRLNVAQILLGNAVRSYTAALGTPASGLSFFSCHFIMAIMTFVNRMCDDMAPVPIPQALVGALFRILLLEVPLRNAREASVDYKDKFRTSKNVAKSCERYELTEVVLGFGKGETSLKDLIRIIDIALGDMEG